MNPEAALQRVEEALRAADRPLEACVQALARAAVREGRPDPAAVDAHQGPAFRLARLHAQREAAAEALRFGALGPDEALLGAGYGGLALESLRRELPYLALHLDGAGAADFAGRGEVLEAVGEATAPRLHDAVWELLDDGREPWTRHLAETHRLLRGSFLTFVEQRVKPLAESLHREDRLIPDEVIAGIAELGAFGLSIPEAHGGFQERPDHTGVVLVTEELSRGALAVGSLATRPEILAKALLRGGTAAQQARWLPRLAAGEDLVAIAVTEPDHGSDVAHIQCAARPGDGGWRISGTKVWSTLAGRAELIALLARSEPDRSLGRRGLSLFVIEKPPHYGHEFACESRGGRLTGRAIATLGYRGMHSFELNLEDYWVPADALVGAEDGRGRGFYLQLEGFGAARLQTAGRALGVMQGACEAARDYARSRRVFDRPLSDFALTREKLAAMACTIAACRQASFAAARLMDEGTGQVEASQVKLLACREAEWVCREAQQLHGGMGYAEEFPVARHFADARVLSIFEGAEEVLALKVIVPALLRRAVE